MQIELTARGFLTAFFRQRLIIFVVFALAAAAGFAYINFAPIVYQSRGSLLVKFGHEAMPDMTKADSAAESSENIRRDTIGSDIEILKSHDLLQAIVNEFGPETIYPGIGVAAAAGGDSPAEAAIKRLADGDLNIKPGIEGYIIEVSMLNANPAMPAKFIHRLFEVFIERQLEVYNNPQTSFLNDQLTLAADRLKHSQAELQNFKTRVGVSSMDEELSRLIQEKGDAENIAFQAVDDSQTKLAALQAQEANLLATYKPDSAPVIKIRENIAVAEKQLAERQADLKAPKQEGSGILATHITDINRKIDMIQSQQTHYNDLVRQVAIDEENYKNYRTHTEEARINEMLNLKKVTQISVLDEPVEALKPMRPRRRFVIVLCALAGAVVSLGLASLAEIFDMRFTTPEQVATTLELPVMAVFPHGRKNKG